MTHEYMVSAESSGFSGGRSPAWIDTHAHLDAPQFDVDRNAVLSRAWEAGIQSIVTVGVNLPSSLAAVALAESHDGIFATVGVQPNEASDVTEAMYDKLRALAMHPQVVAVGEIGLDYYWDRSPRDVQQAVLETQLEVAAKASKPVVLHLRDKRDQTGAFDDALAILRAWVSGFSSAGPVNSLARPCSGVLHCFSGALETARAALDLGFYLGVDGPVTYPNASARTLQALVTALPIDRLLLETDCPYLAPQVHRGKRNEPSYLPYIGTRVAELKGIGIAEVAQATAANARRLFGLSQDA